MPVQQRSFAKPLVFFSASNEDYYWRNQVKEELDNPDALQEWWDDSKIEPSEGFREAIDAAIRRATVAVVLLSPAYLTSETTCRELASLIEENSARSLRLFPILVSKCEWQSLPIANFQIWGANRPLDTLGDKGLRDGLRDIGAKISALVREAIADARKTSNGEPQATIQFSERARLVMSKARKLADDSDRRSITSSCLLFAFAESAGASEDTARFVREYLGQNRNYKQAFEEFRRDAIRDVSAQEFGDFGKVSANVRKILSAAHGYASRTSPNKSLEVHQRHLLAALLTVSESSDAVALQRITHLNLNPRQFRQNLRNFILISAPRDDQSSWDSILMPPSDSPERKGEPGRSSRAYTRYVDGPPGYSPDFCGLDGSSAVSDYLYVEEYAKRLAELIALRETKLPLAIGLFGHWGSGKSHFMNLMDRNIQALAKRARGIQSQQESDSRWCRRIVPVYFNAWHYLDTNLWASLVSEIFETLFEHLAGRSDPESRRKKIEALMAELRSANGAAATVSEKLEQTRAEKLRAEEEKSKAELRAEKLEADRKDAVEVIAGIRAAISVQLPLDVPEEARKAMKILELDGMRENVSTLMEQLRKFHTLRGRVLAAFRAVWAPNGRAVRIAWLGGAVIGAPLLAWLIIRGLALSKQEISKAGAVMIQITALLSALATWARPQLARGRAFVARVEKFAKEAEEHRVSEARKKNLELQVKEQELLRIEQEEREAETQVAEARAKVTQIDEKLQELDPERRFVSFIQERAGAGDYRSQLGLVSMVRRDFEELSRRFVDREEMPSVSRIGERHEQIDTAIDRIVLFVDDLDRCEAERVVVVLQAVHLLLAFPLFAVVVGVDQRCLRESIAEKFRGLISKDARFGDSEPLATPLDYLEKIFHVPFHLPQMTDKGFGTLIEELCKPASERQKGSTPTDPAKAPDGLKEKPTAGAGTSDDAEATSPPRSGPADEETSPQQGKMAAEPNSPARSENTGAVHVGSVPLNPWELAALKQYHLLVRTPRGAKRLLNTYRLMRAGIRQDDWETFRGDETKRGEFRIAMLLLAAAAGHPAKAREWFKHLRSNDQTAIEGRIEDPELRGFVQLYTNIRGDAGETLNNQRLSEWLNRVERFAF